MDLRVQPAEDLDIADLARFAEKLDADVKTQKTWAAQVNVRLDAGKAEANVDPAAVEGFRFELESSPVVVLCRRGGFTFSRLKPYTAWEDIKPKARRAWEYYCDIARPQIVTRLALRFINHIELDIPFELEEYFVSPPSAPPGLSQELRGFFGRIVIPDESGELLANVTITGIPTESPQSAVVVLDVDAYKVVSLEPTSQQIWKVMDSIRNFKNKIFFESVTEKALSLFCK